jgi:hypothetical protein
MCWAGKLSKHYDLDHINIAYPGKSNSSIANTTVNYILNNINGRGKNLNTSDIFVIIGWTGSNRDQIVYQNKMYYLLPGITKGFFNTDPRPVRDARQHYVITHDDEYNQVKFGNYYLMIKNLLDSLKISYLFFNSIHSVVRPNKDYTNLISNNYQVNTALFDMIERDNHYYHAFDDSKTYYNTLISAGFSSTIDGRYNHFTEEANQYWCSAMIKYTDFAEIIK